MELFVSGGQAGGRVLSRPCVTWTLSIKSSVMKRWTNSILSDATVSSWPLAAGLAEGRATHDGWEDHGPGRAGGAHRDAFGSKTGEQH
jgi:hypothetical protein